MSPRAYGASHKCHSTLWSSERWRLPLYAAVVVVATVLVCRDATKLGVFTAGHNVLKTLKKWLNNWKNQVKTTDVKN